MAENRISIEALIRNACGAEPLPIPNSTPAGYIVPSEKLLAICYQLHTHPSGYFDLLSCITGVDNGPEAQSMEVIYHLYSIPYHQPLAIKVILPREQPEVESISGIWRSANWLEREVYDMFGIVFKNHPDLRRILMPADWKGYPLRKDYRHEEYYRGVKIEY
jgi:NADH-quinone oxidoreductase subunit C